MIRQWIADRYFAAAPPCPETPFTAIGDVHGCAALLAQALANARGQIVCVGDYIDRGPDSAKVLSLLQARDDVICLMGNHEEMMLDFIDAPDRNGARWLVNGGSETLDSFGISQKGTASQMRDALRDALGPHTEAWLRALPSFWQSGNVAVTHAGADPRISLDQQATEVFRWGHPKFGRTPRRDGVWVLRGHKVVEAPSVEAGIIEIDIGAYKTGQLCTGYVHRGKVDFTFYRTSSI